MKFQVSIRTIFLCSSYVFFSRQFFRNYLQLFRNRRISKRFYATSEVMFAVGAYFQANIFQKFLFFHPKKWLWIYWNNLADNCILTISLELNRQNMVKIAQNYGQGSKLKLKWKSTSPANCKKPTISPWCPRYYFRTVR